MAALVLIVIVSLLSCLLATPWLIERLRKAEFVGADVNKPDHPLVPNIGGFAVVFGLSCSTLLALVLSRLGILDSLRVTPLLGALSSILLVGFIGVFDDLFALPPPIKGTLPFFAALPLVVTLGGSGTIDFPGLGPIDFGPLYPVLLVPLGVTGAANVTNMLAGFNGLEAGMGAAACLGLAIIAVATGRLESAVLVLGLLGALLAFLRYNWYPSRVFIGDTGTLVIGATLASAVIVGHYELAGVAVIVPYATDFLIKAANRFPSTNWWGIWVDGKLVHAGRPVGLAQAIMRLSGGITERRLVIVLIGYEAIAATVAVLLFGRS